jgi:hypothetical protein
MEMGFWGRTWWLQWRKLGVSGQNPTIPQSYAEEITPMKNWIAGRLAWIDANLPRNCVYDVLSIEEQGINSRPNTLNPTNPTHHFTSNHLEELEIVKRMPSLFE